MITQKELKELVDYDNSTGLFAWRFGRVGAKKGAICGSKNKGSGYVEITLLRKSYLCHRLVFLYTTGSFPLGEVDHINHAKDDNRWCNLRDVHHLDNQKNRKIFKNNKSGTAGVSWHSASKKWQAGIQVNYKSINLGYYDVLDEAIKAREDANIKYGFHINHGKPCKG
tara:strand:+ start:473 stop:976 length:504 start_codon:yes stop_codon:yes gene_type:complete